MNYVILKDLLRRLSALNLFLDAVLDDEQDLRAINPILVAGFHEEKLDHILEALQAHLSPPLCLCILKIKQVVQEQPQEFV